ncbi:hypothetical protein Drorol1_Dr00000200 [Drosera rotundifolia]
MTGGGDNCCGGNCCRNAGALRIEAVNPHPVMETLNGIQYCVNSPPPWLEAFVLGFQHYLLTLGMIVLVCSIIVPQMGGSHLEKVMLIQNMLFAAGLNTLVQSWFGTRLPTVIGASYSFVVPCTTIVLASRYYSDYLMLPHERFKKTMQGIQGALMISSVFQLALGCFGFWRNIVRFLSPLSMVPLVTFTGLGLTHLGFPNLAECVEVGLPQLIMMLIFSHYIPHFMKPTRPIFDRFALLFSTAIVGIYAQILTSSGVYNHKPPQTQLSCCSESAPLISAAPWFDTQVHLNCSSIKRFCSIIIAWRLIVANGCRLYLPRPFQWGKPTFNVGEAFVMMAAALVALTESTGTFLAVARYGSATPVPPSVLGRSAAWLGFGTLLNGMLGSVSGAVASVENAGLLGLTKVGSRRVIQISAAFMIFFSIFAKIGAIFASVPLPVIAASYCIFFGYVSSAGLSFLQFCNINSFRTIFILGFTFFMAISVPQYFLIYQIKSDSSPLHTDHRWFNDMVATIFLSSTLVAALVGLLLDNTVERGIEMTKKDNGAHWWERFILFTKDIRNAEFYSLPCKLNQFFPPL